MDWNTLKQKALFLKDQGQKIFTQAQPYLEKAGSFSEEQVRNTPLFLKSYSDYEAERKEKKKYLLLALKRDSVGYREFLLRSPQFLTKAWQMNATIRFVDFEMLPDFSMNLRLDSDPALIVSYDGGEYRRLIGREAIMGWWSSPCFYEDTNEEK